MLKTIFVTSALLFTSNVFANFYSIKYKDLLLNEIKIETFKSPDDYSNRLSEIFYMENHSVKTIELIQNRKPIFSKGKIELAKVSGGEGIGN